MNIPLVTERIYNTPIEMVWQAITDKDAMREWYFPQLQEFEPVLGAKFQFFNDGSAYQKEWIVSQVVTGRKLAHTWSYKGYPGHSEVSFDLSVEGNQTRFKITHTGLESFPDDPHFARDRFVWGWQLISDKLNNYLQK